MSRKRQLFNRTNSIIIEPNSKKQRVIETSVGEQEPEKYDSSSHNELMALFLESETADKSPVQNKQMCFLMIFL